MLSQVVVNKNTELVHAREVIDIFRELQNLAVSKETSLWRQAVNMNIELGLVRAHEVYKILYEVPPRETEEAKMKDRSVRGRGAPHDYANLTRYKEVFLPTQEVNKSLELIDTHAQEVVEILGESPSHEIRRAKVVATGENFSCKRSMMDVLRLNEESAAGNSKKEDNDEKKRKIKKVKPKEVNMTVDCCVQEAAETMEESKVVAGDGLDEEHAVETEEEETVKLDLALTNDEDMMKSYGEFFVKGDGLKWRKPRTKMLLSAAGWMVGKKKLFSLTLKVSAKRGQRLQKQFRTQTTRYTWLTHRMKRKRRTRMRSHPTRNLWTSTNSSAWPRSAAP